MGKLKQYAAPLAAFAVIVAAASVFTMARLSNAQTAATPAPQTSGSGGPNHMPGHGMWPGVTGTVASVSGSTITLTGKNGTTYNVNASNATISKFANGSKTTIAVSAINNGDTLMIQGAVSGASVTAKTIFDGQLPQMPKPAATGTVSNISGNTITLDDNGTTYMVDASNAALMINKPAGTQLGNSGVQTGDNLTVFGTASGNNITATRIMDGKMTMPGKGWNKPAIPQ